MESLFFNAFCVSFSDGAGRTGIIIALMTQLSHNKCEKTVDIYKYICYLRTQCPAMVMREVSS